MIHCTYLFAILYRQIWVWFSFASRSRVVGGEKEYVLSRGLRGKIWELDRDFFKGQADG